MRNYKIPVIIIFFILGLSAYPVYDSIFGRNVLLGSGGGTSVAEEGKNLNEHFNVLVLGVDNREGENYRSRSDVMIIASLDPVNKTAGLISIPRDSRVQINGEWDKINAAYVYGGTDLAKEVVEDMLDITVDRYAVVNFQSLVHIVDAIGGIEVDVPVPMHVPLENIDLEPGLQVLDGEGALAYSRFRGTPEGDIGRAKRQQEVIGLVADKMLSLGMVAHMPEVVSLVQENIETDVQVDEIVAAARIAGDVMDNGVSTAVVPGKNEKLDGLWFWVPDEELLQQELAEMHFTPGTAAGMNAAYAGERDE